MAGSGSNPKPDKDPHSASPYPSDEQSQRPARILVIEDNKSDILLIREAIDTANLSVKLDVVDNGEKALRYLQQIEADESSVCPSLIILDINLPKITGDEVLRRMRQMNRCAGLPVVVVTSSDSAEDRDMMAKLGVNEYFRKPSDYDEFMKLAGILKALLSPPPQ